MALEYRGRFKGGREIRIILFFCSAPNTSPFMEGFDIVKYHARTLKKGALMLGVVYPAAAIIGNVLGNMNSKK